jgi:protein-S-isoprenylcysteine O-methyltransferase Ste14
VSGILDTVTAWRRRAEGTKAYDFALALPLIGWYAHHLWTRWPTFQDAVFYARNWPDAFNYLSLISEISIYGFAAAVILMLVVRVPPVAKAPGLGPRIAGFIGTFATLAFLELKLAELSLGWQAAATALNAIGCLAGIYCIVWLGRSFSIMAEARQLRTRGVYRLVRHPLYLAEECIVIGSAIQFQQPWAILIALVQLAFQLWRIHNEEKVLTQAFPEYRDYAARTARLIPGIY